MTTSHWTDAHIRTRVLHGLDVHIGYDENGDVIAISTDRDEVVRHLEAYSDQLEEPSPHPVAPCVSWSDAPPWATHVAIDASGEEWWYGTKPLWDENDTVWYLQNYRRDPAQLAYRGTPIDPADAALSCFERPTPVELNEEPRPSGPFRNWNITIDLLHAVNCDDYDAAFEAAVYANPQVDSVLHIKDFVLYLLEK